MYIGMDYQYQKELKIYQNMLYYTYLDALNKGMKLINWGFTGELEKKKLNAHQDDSYVYVQIKDNFKLEAMEYFKSNLEAVVV